MKTFVKIFLVAVLSIGAFALHAQTKKNVQTAEFSVNMHCQNCINTIEKNIPFEKGVISVEPNLETRRLKVQYNEKQTSPEQILKAIRKLKFEASIVEPEGGKKQ